MVAKVVCPTCRVLFESVFESVIADGGMFIAGYAPIITKLFEVNGVLVSASVVSIFSAAGVAKKPACGARTLPSVWAPCS